jgi:uncharacterized RDD family membrane protein YckC
MATAAKTDPGVRNIDDRSRRSIVTPEGVPLPVDLASRSERAAAFLIDLVIILAILLLLVLLGVLIAWAITDLTGLRFAAWMAVALLLAWFVVRSFYFSFFELRWHGATPGKHVFKLRVIDRGGGPLRADAVFARNLMREVEVFLPMTLLLAGAGDAIEGWVVLLTLGWMLILTFMPLFNRDRLRAGDIIAGTWVIAQPKALLLSDLLENAAATAPAELVQEAAFAFTQAQLDIYGIHELQTLENVLRQDGPTAAITRDEVARRIRKKIDWPGETGDSRLFLQSFYAALRRRLEARLLFGVRRKDQHDRR